MRRRLHGGDQRSTRDLATETAEFFGGDDDDLVAPVDGDVLRTLVTDAADELAEARLGILQRPVSRLRGAGPAGGFRWPMSGWGFSSSSYAD